MNTSPLPVVTLGLLCIACSHRPPQVEVPSAEMPLPRSATYTPTDPAPGTLEQMLAGKLSGVSVTPAPAGGIIVRMMGPTSFNGDNEGPLYLVDGTPVEVRPGGALPWLNPRDIESITALKNPADIAVYGVRGANGVIVIKTKKGH